MKYILILFTSIIFSQNISYQNIKNEGEFKKYTSKDSLIISVGNVIKIGFPSSGNKFTYITQGNDLVDSKLNLIEVTITKIEVIKMQNGFLKAYAVFKGFGLIPVYIDIEAAIYFKEIIIE